jgi:DNA (cytosine-5)-methyltransferase 1
MGSGAVALLPGFDNNGEMFYYILREDRWAAYAPAIARWEAVLGRPAPSPTEPGRDERPRLSPRFVEWMMGLPAGHVTDPAIGLTRAQQLKALGNGVVPQQAALALRMLLGVPTAQALLPTAQALLPTAQASDWKGPNYSGSGSQSANSLSTVTALLPTPAVNDMGAGKTPPSGTSGPSA